jgi:hypothetical protein
MTAAKLLQSALIHAALWVGLACALGPASVYGAGKPDVEPVTQSEMGEIRRAFQGIGLSQAEIVRGDDGRITLVGEYENRDAVETAFSAARAVVGVRRVAPTTPANIKYRLKGFDTAFASTVGKMMQKSASPAQPAASSPPPTATPQQVAKRGPRTTGLIVGVGRYKYLPVENSLEGADKDARDLYNLLVSPEGGSLPRDSIRLLVQEQATSVAVKSAMRELVENSQPGDTVIFFAATHGLPNAMGKFDIVLHDTEFPHKKVGSKDQILEFVITNRKTALSDEDFEGFASQLTLKGVRTVIVLDTCYSGKTFALIPGYLPTRTRSLSQHKKEAEYSTSLSQEAITELAQKAKDSKITRIVIVSASENEESMEAPNLGGGAFTQTYVLQLRKIHDFADAFDQTKPAVIRIARTVGHTQTPRMLVVPEDAVTKM